MLCSFSCHALLPPDDNDGVCYICRNDHCKRLLRRNIHYFPHITRKRYYPNEFWVLFSIRVNVAREFCPSFQPSNSPVIRCESLPLCRETPKARQDTSPK